MTHHPLGPPRPNWKVFERSLVQRRTRECMQHGRLRVGVQGPIDDLDDPMRRRIEHIRGGACLVAGHGVRLEFRADVPEYRFGNTAQGPVGRSGARVPIQA